MKQYIEAIQQITALRCPRAVVEKKNSEGRVTKKVALPWEVIDFRETEGSIDIALHVPRGYSAQDLMQETDAIYAACGRYVRIIDRGGVVVVSIGKKDFPPVIDYKVEMLSESQGRAVLLGYDQLGKPIIHNFRVPHLLIAGMSGYGKTDLIRFILYQLVSRFTPDELEIYIIDMKGYSFMPFFGVPHIRRIVRDLAGARSILMDAYTEMNRRSDLVWSSKDRRKAAGFRWRIVLIDEASQISPRLCADRDKELAEDCWRIAGAISCIGREAGIGLIYATQYPTAEVIRGQIKANMDAVVCFKTENEVHSEVTLGRPDAAFLPQNKPGRAILKRDMVHMIVPFIGDDDVWEALLAPYKYEWEDNENEPGAESEDNEDVH